MNRHVMIIGAAGAMGSALAARLASAEGTLTLADLPSARLDRLADPGAGNIHLLPLDARSEDEVIAAFDAAETAAGPLTGLVCVAGGTPATQDAQPGFADYSLADWEWCEAVNARSAFLCAREMLRRRRALPVADARLLLVASMAAHRGSPGGGVGVAYHAMKSAVVSLGRSAALEGARYGMTCNTIAPGGFDTGAFHVTTTSAQTERQLAGIPLGRLGQVTEFADLAAFLLSPAAGYITGATLDINGGAFMT